MDNNLDIGNRIKTLEDAVESIRSGQIASLQRWRFCIVVALHAVIAFVLTLMSTFFPVAFINGWMLGCFLWALVWYECSPRVVVDRLSRLFLAGLVIVWMLYEAQKLAYGMFPEVAMFAVLCGPFVMLIARFTMAVFQTSLNAPDVANLRMRPLSIVDLFISVTLVALLGAILRVEEPAAMVKPLVIILLAVVPAGLLSLMVVGFARTEKWPLRIVLVGLTVFLLAMGTYGVLAVVGESMNELSWVELDLVRDDIGREWNEPNLITAVPFAASVVMPCIMTLMLLWYQGYRLMSRCEVAPL